VNATAAYAGLNLDRPEYTHFQDNKTPEFLEIFPHGRIPAFKSSSGFALTEGAAIARYFAAIAPESGLLPKSVEDQALVDQWCHLVETEIMDNTVLTWAWCHGKFGPYNKETHDIITRREMRAIATVDKHLEGTKMYLVGDRITLADLTLASAIKWALSNTLDTDQRAKYPNVLKHFELVSGESSLKELFGETEYIEKAIQFEPTK
jgi:glutathione S-transferase